eukprot:CAMPEP_0119422860 /NCGR_PEP_ID=MMETSP1335-20130426/29053_1 /TAXON_ID=259385 /ORGANISM="Chrysoculter rhomboideus, Strain RCC1486" /LENGTH=95 /DNA_ID=CAMNT_0007448329 /DNA_START=9 /DNA_END=292 /DNA_ORIENTATION=-
MAAACAPLGIALTAEPFEYRDEATIGDAVGRLRTAGLRIVVAVASVEDALAMVRNASTLGMVGPGYHWVFTDGLPVSAVTTWASDPTLRAALVGA